MNKLREQFEQIVKSRIDHLMTHHCKWEGRELREALNIILEYVPPDQFESRLSNQTPIPDDEQTAKWQNQRMREWFEYRTGLEYALLSEHMKLIDLMLSNQTTPEATRELYESVTKWQDEIFTKATPLSCVNHLIEEVAELKSDIQKGCTYSDEVADCFLLLFGVCNKFGMEWNEVVAAIESKMVINRERKWGKVNELGYVKHIQDTVPSPEVMANVTDGKTPEPLKIKCSIRPFDCEHYAGDVDGPHYCGLTETDCQYAKHPVPVTPCNGLKSREEILAEVKATFINGTYKDCNIFDGVGYMMALEAMQIYHDQFKQEG